MILQNKFFISILISFFLLMFSLFLSYNNISKNNNMLKFIQKDQIRLSYLSNKLNYSIKTNQAYLLQLIILDDSIEIKNINRSFENLKTIVNSLDEFTKKEKDVKFDKVIHIIKNRVFAYIAVKNSLLTAIESKDEDDIYDALIGFNQVTVKFSKDIQNLITIANNDLTTNIQELDATNKQSTTILLFSFLIAVILISFSVYKISLLNKKFELELDRAESAEKMQKKLQEQLLKYNEDLELEITKKTKELKTKIYTHFLTGLPNRNRLLEDSDLYHFKQLALLNIDKFQKFNDVYGEEIGNIALQLSSEFLKDEITDTNTLLYHIGGDEFVLAIKDSYNLDNVNFTRMIEIILSKFSKKDFKYEDKSFHFNMSAGISFSGKKKILAYADMALKDAKTKNIQVSIFDDDKKLEKNHINDIECHKQLIAAINTKKVISFFQPIVPIQDKTKAMKYESLVRIQTQDGKIIPPFNFINVAKINRIYDKITLAVVNNTLDTITKYKIPCSLNISMDDIENIQTLDMLYSRFNQFEYNHLITIELLETETFKDYELVHDFCTKIRSYSIKIALDDFGSGYSNFSHILKLPVDFIKIDASLISNIDRDINSRIMVETIVDLAKKLNVETIAEFVSSQEILDVVTELKVDYAQGYHLGKPERIEKHLKS